MNIREELARRVLIFDGGMGTMLQAAGLPAGYEPELWNLERPDAVRAVHVQYLAAGADIVTTNTFGAHAVQPSGHPAEAAVTAAVSPAGSRLTAVQKKLLRRPSLWCSSSSVSRRLFSASSARKSSGAAAQRFKCSSWFRWGTKESKRAASVSRGQG